MAVRFFILVSFFGLLYGALGLKLYHIQVVKKDYYFQRAEAQNDISHDFELRRGQIFFTDKYDKKIPAALNKDYPIIYAVPKEVADPEEAAERLKLITGDSSLDLVKALSNKKNSYKLIVDKASKAQINAFTEAGLPGLYTRSKQYRFYTHGFLASHLLGFVGFNEKNKAPLGLYGIEKLHDEVLSGGEDISLTIDRNIQNHAEEVLRSLYLKFNAAGGTIIIEEPSTGKIIALANIPYFDPNNYKEYAIKDFLNPSVQSVYEPGSVFKPLTMAAGIEFNKLTPETTYYDSGSVTLNGKRITNWDHKAYGKITMTNVIERSINTGAVYAESLVGHDNFHEFLKRLGFGIKTDIDLPDEVSGSLRNLENKKARAIDFATAAFGQGTAVTPIQLINAFSSIANGGLLMRPYIDRSLSPSIIRRVMKTETTKAVTLMMESAVEKAIIAKIPQYKVAGKTGTAQIPDLVNGGYLEEYIHTYVGFAPASNPRFVALLKLDRPSALLAGETVVPAFRELSEYILNYYNTPPDDLVAPVK